MDFFRFLPILNRNQAKRSIWEMENMREEIKKKERQIGEERKERKSKKDRQKKKERQIENERKNGKI